MCVCVCVCVYVCECVSKQVWVSACSQYKLTWMLLHMPKEETGSMNSDLNGILSHHLKADSRYVTLRPSDLNRLW